MPDVSWINANAGAPAYSAAVLRRLDAMSYIYGGRVLGARHGVRPGGATTYVQVSGVNVTVQPHVGIIDPGLTTTQGPYTYCLEVVQTPTGGNLVPANATNPRKDIVVVRVYDNDEDSSGLRLVRTEYIPGTAASTPVEPAVPAGALRLATIDVPASGGGSPVVTVNAPYTVASGGVIPCRSKDERDALSPYPGMLCYRRDRRWIEGHDGTAWRVIGTAYLSNPADLATAIDNPYSGQLAMGNNTLYIYYAGSGWQEAASPRTPRGIIARGNRGTASSYGINPDIPVLRIDSVPLKAGRLYKVSTGPLPLDSSVVNDEVLARIRYTMDNTQATIASPILPGSIVQARLTDVFLSEHASITTLINPGAVDVVASFLLTVGRLAGTGNVGLATNAASIDSINLWVEDIGADVPDTGVDL